MSSQLFNKLNNHLTKLYTTIRHIYQLFQQKGFQKHRSKLNSETFFSIT